MNKIYKVIWSKVKNCYIVVSELAKRVSRSSSPARAGRASLAAVMAATALTIGTIGMDTVQAAKSGAVTQANYIALATHDSNGNAAAIPDYIKNSDNYRLVTATVTDAAGNPVEGMTRTYYVLNGYDVIVHREEQVIDGPTSTYENVITEVVKNGNPIPSNSTLTSAQSIISPIVDGISNNKVRTVLGTSLNSIGMSTYAAATNGGIDARNTWQYIIEDSNNRWVDVNDSGNNAKMVQVTYKEADKRYHYTTGTGSSAVDHIVYDEESIYYLSNNSGTTNPYVFLRSDGTMYTGTVRGLHNEILMTAVDNTTSGGKVLYTYWGAKLNDDETLVKDSDVTVGDLNKAFRTFEANDKNLAQADIANIKLTQQSNGGTLGLTRGNDADVLGNVTISSTGGANGQDVKVQFTNTGVKRATQADVTASGGTINLGDYISDPSNVTTFTVDAGSKVVANNGGSGAALKTLSVNGTTYSIVDTDTNNYVTSGNVSYANNGNGTLTLDRQGMADVTITGLKNTYTTGTTIDGNNVKFNRNDGTSYSVNFTAGGGNGTDTYVQVGGNNGIKLNTGSKVVANSGNATQTLNTISINGTSYSLAGTDTNNYVTNGSVGYTESVDENGVSHTEGTLTLKGDGIADVTISGLRDTTLVAGPANCDMVDADPTDEDNILSRTYTIYDTAGNAVVLGDVASHLELQDVIGDVETNTTNITDLTSRVSTNETNIATNTTNISQNKTSIEKLTTTVNNNSSQINTNTQNITNLTTKVDGNTTNIATNTENISKLTTKVDGNTTNIATNTQNITKLTTKVDAGWDAQINGTTAKNVNPDSNTLNFVAKDGGNVTIEKGANGEIVFSATDTDTNNYVTGGNVSYTDSQGTLTLTQEGIDNAVTITGLQNTYTTGVTVDKANNNVNFVRNDGRSYGVNFTAGGGEKGADTFVQIGGANGIQLSTGSKVEGTGKATPDGGATALSGITINGKDFLVPVINANTNLPSGEAPYLTSIELNGQAYKIVSEGSSTDYSIVGEKVITDNGTTYNGAYKVESNTIKLNRIDNLTQLVTEDAIVINDVASASKLTEVAGKVETNTTNITKNATDITNLTETVNKGWNLKVNNGEAQNVKLGDTVTLLEGDNMVVTSGANGITFATKKDVAFNTVSVTDTVTVGNIAIDKANGIGMSGMKITNLAEGKDDTDAVNVSQLNQKVTELTTNISNSKTVVEAGNNITISSETDQTTGQVTYTIDGKKTTVSTDDTNLTITAGTEANGVTDYNVSLNESITLGNTAANQVMINGLTGTLKLGNTVVISTSGINMGGMSITNLSAGVNDTDAVNVSQLNDAVDTLTANDQHLVVNPNADAGHYAVNKADDTVTLKVQGKDANGGTVYTDVVIDDIASATELDALDTRVTTNTTDIDKIEEGYVSNVTTITNNKGESELTITTVNNGNESTTTFTDTRNDTFVGGAVTDNNATVTLTDTKGKALTATITNVAQADDLNDLENRVSTNETNITNIENKINGLKDTTLKDAGLSIDDDGNISMTVTDTSGNSVTGKVNIDDYVSDKIDAEAADAKYNDDMSIGEAISKNATDIATNAENIAQNAKDIAQNKADIATNAENIAQNAKDIAQNKADIAQNAKDIAQNKADIAQNAKDIASNTDRITTIENTYVRDITQDGNSLTITQGNKTTKFEFTDTNTTNAKLENTWNDDDSVTLTLTDSAGKTVATTIKDVASAKELDQETTDRIAADKAEEKARQDADAALNTKIDKETTDRIAADEAEAKARQDADKAEAEARQAADKALDDKIVSETNERVKADTALNERINSEQTERVNADTALNNRIDQEIIDRQNNDIVAGSIDKTDGTVTLTKGNGDPIIVGNICDSRLDNVTYDEEEGKLTFTVTDHYNQDKQTKLEVDGIASEKALEKETSERQAMDNAIINDYTQRTDALGGQINSLGHRMTKAVAGAAALAALHPLDFDPDDKLSFSAGVGNYGGSTAAAIGAFYRPNERVMFSIGGTVGNGEEMVNAGVSFALGKGGKVNTSRVAMTHEINDLRQQVAYLSAVVAQLASQNGYQFTDMKPFPDTAENHWAYEYVAKLAAEGIVEGYPSGNFDGDRTMTRYEFAAMLFHALEKGITLDTRVINEFEPELGRLSVERIKGEQNQKEKIERVRVNDSAPDRDVYGGKINVGKNWP